MDSWILNSTAPVAGLELFLPLSVGASHETDFNGSALRACRKNGHFSNLTHATRIGIFNSIYCALWEWVRNCFGNSFFFFRDFFFFFGWGWFWGCPGSFLGKRRGERQVCAGFSGHLGVVLGLSRLRSGETSGEMQVPSRFGHKKHQKTASKSKLSRSFLFSVCIYLCWCVCVCLW